MKRFLLGTLVVILVLAVLGGVGAVAYGVGMRQALGGQTRILVAPNANGAQVIPPLRGQQAQPGAPSNRFRSAPNQNINPRVMPFMQGRSFQTSVRGIMPFRSFNPISAFFGFAIPLLLIVLLVALIIRVMDRRPFWGGHGRDKMMFIRGGPDGMPPEGVPPFFEEWHKRAHGTPGQQPPDEAKEI